MLLQSLEQEFVVAVECDEVHSLALTKQVTCHYMLCSISSHCLSVPQLLFMLSTHCLDALYLRLSISDSLTA